MLRDGDITGAAAGGVPVRGMDLKAFVAASGRAIGDRGFAG